MSATAAARAPFPARLREYLEERFPVAPSFLTAFLLAGTADVVAQASRGAAPALDRRTLLSTVFVFCALFVLRVLDEHKDEEEDRVAHPERVLQRGVVSLRELDVVAVIATCALVAAAASAGSAAFLAASVCLAYLGLMRVEFFAPAFLRARLLAYALSHQVITPLLCLAVVVARLEPALDRLHGSSVAQAWTAASLGLVFEIGRKVRTPEEEIAGDDTYSSRYGTARAARLTAACGVLAACAAVATCLLLRAPPWTAAPAVLGGLVVVGAFGRFSRRPQPGQSKMLLGAVALGALLTYATLGAAAFGSTA